MAVQKNPSKVVDASFLFQDEQVDALYKKIGAQETHHRNDIDRTIATVNAINVKTLSPVAREKFQSLCGRLHTININMMVDAIVDEAQKLKQNGAADPRDIEFLRAATQEIWENNRLSKVNSNLLRVASITLAQLVSNRRNPDADLSDWAHTTGKKPDMLTPRLNQQLKEEMVLPESAELAFDLLDVAGLLYQGKVDEGLAKTKALPQKLKLPAISQDSSKEEFATFIQEVVVKSFEIGRKDGYVPSEKEIQELLEEAANLS